jgi:glycosyltransferase involved in cell wall biosynthesis
LSFPKVLYLQEPFRRFYEAAPHLPWMALPPNASPRHKLFGLLCLQGMREQLRREWESARAYDAILVNSYFSAESVVRAYDRPARVCYLGIDTEYFAPGPAPREEFILGIGQFIEHKNIHLVLEAMAQLPAPRPRLLWIGNMADPHYLARLEKLAQQSGVPFEPHVRVEDAELKNAMHRARFVIYASHLEPFGLAPLEANACGAAVVGLKEGGLRETIVDGENGLTCEPDAHSLSRAIARLWQNPEEAAKMGERGRRIAVEKWSEAAAVTRLEEQLYRVLEERKADAA